MTMDTNELELLKRVLPDGYEVVNEGIEDNGHSLMAIWDGDDWQHPIADYTTAKQVIDKIVVVERAWSTELGAANVRGQMRQVLGLNEELHQLHHDLRQLMKR
jgi:hypothetical protein